MSTADHFVDALKQKGGGAVDDTGKTFKHTVENRWTETHTKNGPVIIKRPPAGAWACDMCHTQGSGWDQIERHFARTEHRIYTEVRPPR